MKFFSLIMLMSMTTAMVNAQGESASESVGKTRDSQELSSADRFRSIKGENALDETRFWARQLSEHALFLHLGIEDEALKKRGLAIHKKFEAFRKDITEGNLSKVLPLTKELRAYKMEIVKLLEEGKWIGWIFLSFAQHIVQELDYFVDKLNGIAYSVKDEIDFWSRINSDHAAFESHLLDPYERELSQKASELSDKITAAATEGEAGVEESDVDPVENEDESVESESASLENEGGSVESEEDMFINISLRAWDELDEFNKEARSLSKANKIKSVIHPVLMDHVIREGERSKQKLQELKDQMEAETEDSSVQEKELDVEVSK